MTKYVLLNKVTNKIDRFLRYIIILAMLLPNFTSLAGTAQAARPQTQSAGVTPAINGSDTDTKMERPAIARLKYLYNVPIPIVRLEATPQYIVPGESVTTTWVIDERQLPEYPNGTLELSITYPISFTLQQPISGTYNVITPTLVITNPELSGSVVWNTTTDAVGPFNVMAAVNWNSETLARDSLTIGVNEVTEVAVGGGTITALDGQVQVAFPEGALSEDVTVSVHAVVADDQLPYTLSGAAFEITAQEQDSRIEVSSFSEPVTIEVNYDETKIRGNESTLTLFYFDELEESWVPLPTRVNTEQNLVIGWSDHLTAFDINPQDWEAARLPSMAGFQVSTYTGAATYSFPIQVPPGPAGLQPSLSLSYNSQTVDSAGSRTQASWVGMGWSLDSGYIQRNQNGTPNYYEDDTFTLQVNGVGGLLLPIPDSDNDPNIIYYRLADDNFWRIRHYLASGIVSGYTGDISYWLVEDKTGTKYYFGNDTGGGMGGHAWYPAYPDACGAPYMQTWQWALVQVTNSFGKKLLYTYTHDGDTKKHPKYPLNGCSFDANMQIAIYPNEIIYPDGNYKVRFNLMNLNRTDYDGGWESQLATVLFMKRMLDSIDVLYGNTVIRSYDLNYNYGEIFPNVTWKDGAKTPALEQIIEYGLGGIDGNHSLPATTFIYDEQHLVEAHNGNGGGVSFEYEETTGQPWYASDSSQDPLTYDVEDNWIYGGGDNECANPAGYNVTVHDPVEVFHPGQVYRFLVRVHAPCSPQPGNFETTIHFGLNDGYGNLEATDSLTVTYEEGNNANGTMIGYIVVPDTATQAEFFLRSDKNLILRDYDVTPVVTRYRVTARTIDDDLTGDASAYTYEYEGAAVNDAEHSEFVANKPADNLFTEPYSEFRGNQVVTETAPSGLLTRYVYFQDDHFKGQVITTTVMGPNEELFSESFSESDFITETLESELLPHPEEETSNYYKDLEIVWTYSLTQTSFTYDPASPGMKLGQRMLYEYLEADQNTHQFGNLTRTTEQHWNSIEWVSRRGTQTRYYPFFDADKYLVGLSARTDTFDCLGEDICNFDTGPMLSSVWYLYDGSEGYGWNAGNKLGILTGQRSLACFAKNGVCVDSESTYDQLWYSDVYYGYDAWGNQTSVTSYANYTKYNTSEGLIELAKNTYGSGEKRYSETVYDFTYHTYPIESKAYYNESNFYSTFTGYNFNYGLPTSITGPNGPDTNVTAIYDEFGRIESVFRSGDDINSPSTMIAYHTETNLFWTEAQQKMGDGTYNSVRKFYNGLGQLIQVQQVDIDQDGTDVIVDYDYDESGRLVWQSIPYTLVGDNSYHVGGDPARNPDVGAITTYDILGRTTMVTAPDGTTQSYAYSLITQSNEVYQITQVTDANQHTTTTRTDKFGHTISVVPPDGPTLSYDYDIFDRLTTVNKNPVGSGTPLTTTILYDISGRKLEMQDPDMGTWKYDYDALGNLLYQRDAKNQATCLYYDMLNRLEGKIYTTNSTPCPSAPSSYDVLYNYDEGGIGAYALGQRTSMEDATGTTEWTYDARGRTTSMTRSFETGLEIPGEHTLSYTYNTADQLQTVTYPDGEVVTTDYNTRGLPESLDTSLYGEPNYVQLATYDYLARLTELALGDILFTNYGYNDLTVQGGRLHTLTVGDLLDLTYNYDPVGNINWIDDYFGNIQDTQRQSFTYDDVNRLETASANEVSGVAGYNYTYTFDELGRLEGKEGATLEYDTTQPHAAAALIDSDPNTPNDTYAYDANGNMTTRVEGGITYNQIWNTENKLARVEWTEGEEQHVTTYAYDGDSNRLLKVEYVDPPTGNPYEITTIYIGGVYEEQMTTSGLTDYLAQQGHSPSGGRRVLAAMVDNLSRLSKVPGNLAKPHLVSTGETALPQEVANDWWTAAQEEIRAGEYNITWLEGTDLEAVPAAYQAPNRAHGLRTYYTASGIRLVPRSAVSDEEEKMNWEWGLQLESYGYPESMQQVGAPAEMEANGNRFEYRYQPNVDDSQIVFVEWYVNDERGLEQGFVIGAAPQGGADRGDLVVELASTGNLLPMLTDDGSTIEFVTEDGERVLRYGNLYAYDANGQELPARLALAGCQPGQDCHLQLRIDDRQAIYPVTIDPLATSAAWTAESNQANAQFGYTVATAGDINGDGYSDVIIGAPYYDNGQTDEGKVFVYLGSSTGLGVSGTPTNADWAAERNQANARLGFSVATAGDVNKDGKSDVIIGAPYYSNGQANEGTAYVYLGSTGGLNTSPVWTGEDNFVDDAYGFSVATAGDVNGDGYSDIIVGVPYHDSTSPTVEGCAYVYYGYGDGVNTSGYWLVHGTQSYANFGYSVATAGDVNGDGYADVIVGVLNYSGEGSTGGVAYVYHGSSTGLSTTRAWEATLLQEDAKLGHSVGTAGDVNGDGYADVIVGVAYYDLPAGADSGQALVFQGGVTGLGTTPVWSVDGELAGARYGHAVATAGDVNGDGYSDVIVGARFQNGGQSNEGRTYVYYGGPNTLSTTPGWNSESNQANAHYGILVRSVGDVNGDGYADILVGMPDYDNGQTNEGKVLLYYGAPNGLSTGAVWEAESNQPSAYFGRTGGAAGDVNGDGYADFVIGAPGYSNGQANEGCIHIVYGDSPTPSWSGTCEVEGNQVNAQFGASVSGAGDVEGDGYADVIVGAPGFSNGQTGEGAAFLYRGSGLGLQTTPIWLVEGNQIGGSYGAAVSTAGDVNADGFADVVVGAYMQGAGEEEYAGKAYVYHGSVEGLSVSPNWMGSEVQPDAHYGYSVATAGDVNGDGYSDVVIGVPDYYPNGGRTDAYYGGSSGLNTTTSWTVAGGQANAQFGYHVASAGDVNGDGYSDVAVSAPAYDNGQIDEGRVLFYLGGSSGLSVSASWTAESNQANAGFGVAAAAGDVNSDSYADLMVGAPYYDNGQTDEGSVTLYYGNGGRGVSMNPRQFQDASLTTPLVPLGATNFSNFDAFTMALLGRTPYGTGKVALEWEVKPFDTPFNGTGLQHTGWSDIDFDGEMLNGSASGLAEYTAYHWRVRLWYNPATTPFQPYSRWITMPMNGWNEQDLRTRDITAPTSQPHSLSGTPGSNGWYVSPVTFTLSASDNPGGAGLDRIEYRLDGCIQNESWLTYQPPLVLAEDGVYALCYRAVDRMGNYEDPSINPFIELPYTVKVDNSPPETIVTLSDTPWQENWYRSDPLTVTFSATDADGGSGVQAITYRLDGGNWQTVAQGFVVEISGAGLHTLYYRTQDLAGNWESEQALVVNLDSTAPTVTGMTPTDGEYLTSTQLSLTVGMSDNMAGIDPVSTTLYLDGEMVNFEVVCCEGSQNAAIAYNPAYQLAEGRHTAFLRVYDLAGNFTEALWRFTIDSYTSVQVASPLNGTLTNQETETLTIDTEAGQPVTITVDGMITQVYTATSGRLIVPGWPLAEGANVITFQAEDLAGNLASASLNILRDSNQHAVSVYAEKRFYSPRPFPNGITMNEPLAFFASAIPRSGDWQAETWEMHIMRQGGASCVTTLSGVVPPGDDWMIYWQGLCDGNQVPDGEYSYQLEVTFNSLSTNQEEVLASPSGVFMLDSTNPAVPQVDLSRASYIGNTLWFNHAVVVTGTVTGDAVAIQIEATERITMQVTANVGPNGQWLAELPLADGQMVNLAARAVDTAGNLSNPSSSFRVGLSADEIFAVPASLSDLYIGAAQAVTITATTRSGGAPVDWVRASVPTEVIELENQGASTWAEVWNTPASGPYQGVVLVRINGQDTAQPPQIGSQIIAPYLDFVPPYLSVHYPPDGHAQASNMLLVGGVAEPFSQITMVAEQNYGTESYSILPVNADVTGHWQTLLTGLGDGEYTLTAQAEDQAGNLSVVVEQMLIIDTHGPVVETLDYTPGRYVQSWDALELHALLSDLTGIRWAEVTVQDLPQQGGVFTETFVSQGNGWYGVTPELNGSAEGRKPLTITSEDWLGNPMDPPYAGPTIYFIVDDTPPAATAPMLSVSADSYLWLENGGTLYCGPHSNGTFTVMTSGDDRQPPLADEDVSGLDWMEFPDLFDGQGLTHWLMGVVTSTVSHTYQVNGMNCTLSGTNWQVTLRDRSENPGYAPPFTVWQDSVEPTTNLPVLTAAGEHLYHPTGETVVYYSASASGSLGVSLYAVDNHTHASGMYQVRFPLMFGTEPVDDTPENSNYTAAYTIGEGASSSGEFTLHALDHVGNDATRTIKVLKDTEGPVLSNPELSVSGVDTHTYLTNNDTLLYYSASASGTLHLGIIANDPQILGFDGSGVDHLVFPSLFGLSSPEDSTYPYGVNYMINGVDYTGVYSSTAVDHVDNSTTGGAVTLVRDVTAPQMTGLAAQDDYNGFVLPNFTVVWSASDSQSGVEKYDVQSRIWPNGAWNNWQMDVDGISAPFTNGENGTIYQFQARARDRVDNQSGWTTPPLQVTVDGQAPTAVVSAPEYAGAEIPVYWSGNDGSGSGVANYDVQYCEGTEYDCGLENAPWVVWLQGTILTNETFLGVDEESYCFSVRARDNLGQDGEWSALDCTEIDTELPTVQIGLSPQSGLLIHVSWQGSDGAGSGIDHYDVQYSPDGNNWEDWMMSDPLTEASYLSADGLTNYFRVRAVDLAGNESAWAGDNTVVYSLTKYYAFGAQRVAMRQCHNNGTCAGAMYLHGDHLGSVSLVTDDSGSVVSQARYTPYGEQRWPAVSQSPTDFGYTGQRADSFGLMDYNARFYSPHLGRFVSADTVVPNPGKAVDFDRYAYSSNNPIRYRDPSGHGYCDSEYAVEEECGTWYTTGLNDKLTEDQIRMLIMLIAFESGSGWVPDNVNYMKAWALLNKLSFDAAIINDGTRSIAESWGNHESGNLDKEGYPADYEKRAALLAEHYENYLGRGSPSGLLTAEEFDLIDAAVRSAVADWYEYGPGSSADLTGGATGFWDAPGLHFPDGLVTDPYLKDIPNYEEEKMANESTMEDFSEKYSNLAVSQVYQYGYTKDGSAPIYNFTVFHGTFVFGPYADK